MAEPAEKPEDRVAQLVAAIVAKGDFPAAARVIQRLHDAVRRENCNALEVARVILDDPGLSSKVLRVVNSSFYRPRGEPVSTITRAVFLLGFEAIRDLATGLVLLDEVARASGDRGAIRDLLRQCVICGSVSRALSAVVGYPNPEEAYLLGLFANWGRLCFAAYYPERYERALRSAQARASLEQALGEEFGLGSDELATAMLARWNFPASYARYFGEPHAGAARAVAAGERLFAVVDVANEYAARAIDDADPDVRAELEGILRTTETSFGRRFDDIRAAVEQAVEEAREHVPSLRGSGTRSSSTTRARGTTPAAVAGAPGGAQEREQGAAGETSDPMSSHATLGILAEITRAILGHENINDTLAMVLEGVARTGGFEIAFLALLNGRKDHLVGRLGWGEGVTQFLGTLRVPVMPGAGVLAEAVLEREARVVTAKAAAVLGGGGASAMPVESLVVHPLVVRGKAIGVLVAARTDQRPSVGPADVTLVQLFCNQAGLALDRAVG